MTALQFTSTIVASPNPIRIPRPTAEAFSGPEWPDEELKCWVMWYQRIRADSIDSANDRTAGTVPYCEFKMDAMLQELERRRRLAQQSRRDPCGPRWSTAGHKQRTDLIQLAQDLKAAWPIDRFLTELMLVELKPAGRHRWRCQCVSPAHRDSEPSMMVYGEDNHVHCYGCGAHGDVIDLTALFYGLASFTEAVRKLAEVSGAPVEGRAA